ncbi:hypothetical protein K431DRAFT_289320 [Polychaeton citri CBS 116435]|uniref:BZIP domain-containing protein n=1 Tax=Polychaeton citri CBS 116435 TaxID=1314669 RepID=A0A9P4PX44_9PEZI|nr:hypothetical protein K431DRAFT_289320 [Polychaeton citri CBS 116435]
MGGHNSTAGERIQPVAGNQERVPIPPARAHNTALGASPASVISANQPAPSGPMSSSIQLPARPRPGRKPIPTEDAADRRRLQNRLAQRNFRDKRQQRVNDLRIELEDKKKDYEGTIADYERRHDSSKREIAELKRENAELRKLLEDVKSEVKEIQASRNIASAQPRDSFNSHPPSGNLTLALPTPIPRNPGPMASYGHSLTPPEDNAFEMDFTYAFPKPSQAKQLKTSSSNENMLWNEVTNDGCGFCNTRSTFCACKESQAQPQQQQQQNSSGGGGCSTGGLPGSCDKCRSDPVFARKCQELRSTVVNFRPAAPEDMRMYDGQEAPTTAPQGQQRGMSCFEMITQLEPMASNKMSISELFGGQHIDARPSVSGQGYSLDDQQAAQALQRLSVSFSRHAAQPAPASDRI